ncbi:MAG: hypothetical protein ACRCTZ_18890 [Sarcina sp.]
MDNKEFIKLSTKLFEEILSLKEEDIQGFLNGEKKFAFINNKKEEKPVETKVEKKSIKKNAKKEKVITGDNQIEYIVKKLDKVKSREEAKVLLGDKKITNKMLRAVGDVLGLYINSKATKAKIIDTLIEETIGLKLKMKTLRNK